MTTPPPISSYGDNAVHFVVGGDWIEGSKLTGEPEFYDLDLGYVEPPDFDSPPHALLLANELETRRVLFLAGRDFPEKLTFAHHIAWLLQEKQALTDGDDQARIGVKQWKGGSEVLRLDAALQTEAPPTVFILDQIRPFQIQHDPRRLLDQVQRSHHFAIVTTDASLEEWGHADSPAGVPWKVLTRSEIYDDSYLGHFLRKALWALREEIPEGVFPHGRPEAREGDLELPLVEGMSLLEAAKALGSPDRIRAFTDWLARAEGPVRKAQVRRQIQGLQGDKAAIGRWYRMLDRRLQHLSVGVTLLDGLLDDQLFAALEMLLDKSWRERDPRSAAFDYADLQSLSGYFRRLESRSGGARVTSNSRRQRRALLEVAWGLHRRQILAALPVLVEFACSWADWHRRPINLTSGAELLPETGSAPEERPGEREDDSAWVGAEAGESAGAEPGRAREAYVSRWQRYGPERELWGTFSRRSRLLAILAESLSDLGTLSLNAVDRALIELASNPQPDVQAVAATAIASWRQEPDHAWRFYSLLTRWNQEAAEKRHRAGGELAQRLARVRSTVVQVVGHATRFDPPNRLATQLRRLLEEFAQDPDPAIRESFGNYTLPLAVARHRRQLDTKIQVWVQQDDLIEPVARGWAQACGLRPEEGCQLLSFWWEWLSSAPPASPQEPPGQRERCLAALIATYEVLGSIGSDSPVPAPEILHRLGELLREQHPYVRVRVINAFVLLVALHLDDVPENLQRLLAELSLEERRPVVDAFVKLYLRQRADLQGGDYAMEHEGARYPLWARPGRPRTAVEQSLERWLADEEVPEVQQLALEAMTELRATPVDREERRVLGLGPPRQVPETAEPEAHPPEAVFGFTPPVAVERPRLRPLLPGQRFILRLATLGRSGRRRVLEAPVPELVEQDLRGLERMPPVLSDLRSQGGVPEEIGRYLERFRNLYRNRGLLYVGAVAAVLLLIYLLL